MNEVLKKIQEIGIVPVVVRSSRNRKRKQR